MPKKKEKNKMLIWIILAVIGLFLFMSQPKKEAIISEEVSDGEEIITPTDIKKSGGGGGGGGVPSNGDPDEPCEDCDLYWVENALSTSKPPFSIPEYLSKNGRLIPSSNGDAPQGHWECRGDCPLKNGYKQICKPRPKLIDPSQMGQRPHRKTDIEMECYCTLEEPCHLEFGNIFCERGIPDGKLIDILTSNVEGTYMDIAFSRIREHCKIAKCEGGCAVSGEKCVFETTHTDTGDYNTACKCKGDTCHKEYVTYPTRGEIISNINYNLLTTGIAKISDFADITKTVSARLPFKCAGECIESNKQCLKEGNDCICKIPEGPMPLAQPCSAISVNGDNEWWKCLNGYCDNVPFCYPAGVSTPGWYLGSALVKADNNCAGCVAYCGAIGTRSQGWYSSCNDMLIMWDNTCNLKSPCFYNTYSNKCECTPYTSNCAWEVDWGSFSGQISDSNKPTRYCDGNCPYEINVEETCQKTTTEYGEECKCIVSPSQDPCNSICINLGKNYKSGRTIQSLNECTNTVEEPYIDNSGRMCCCSFVSAQGSSGVSDMDNDGIPDNLDECPTQAGTKLNNGCPLTFIRKTSISRILR